MLKLQTLLTRACLGAVQYYNRKLTMLRIGHLCHFFHTLSILLSLATLRLTVNFGNLLGYQAFSLLFRRSDFRCFTDHAPLRKALFSRSQNFSPRQQHHLDYIAQFTSDLRYVKGEENVVADCLSRITASVFEEFKAVDFLEMAASQQLDPVINHLQKTPNALKLEHRPIPNKGVSILGDVSTGSFRLLVPSKFC